MKLVFDIFDLKYTVDLETNMTDEFPTIKNTKKLYLNAILPWLLRFFPQKLDWMAAILDFSTIAARGGAHAGSRKIMNAYDGIYPRYKLGNSRTKWTIRLLYWTKFPDY